MKIIFTIEKILAKLEGAIIVVMLSLMVLLAFLQVLLRNFFSFGFLWGDPLLRYVVLWVGFIGAVLATKEEKHFGVEILNRFLSHRTLHVVRFFVDTFAGIVSFLLFQAALQFLEIGIGEDSVDLFGISKKYYLMIIPITFGFMSLHFLLRVARHFYGIVGGGVQE